MGNIKFLFYFLVVILSTLNAYAQDIIYDNLTSGTSTNEISYTGNWCTSNLTPYYGIKSLQNCSESELATYSYNPFITNGVYDLYIRWVEDKKLSSKASVSVSSSDYFVVPESGAMITSYMESHYTLNQNQNGGYWVYLGRFTSVGGSGSLIIKVSNANGNVNTDGIKLIKIAEFLPPCNLITGIGCN